MKQWICEDTIGTTVSLGRFSYPYVLQYLLYEIRYFGRIPIMIYVRTWNYTLNNVWFLVSNMSRNTGVLSHKLINCTHTGKLYPFAYNIYQDIRAYHQRHCLQSSSWMVHQRVTGYISTDTTWNAQYRKTGNVLE